jgi:hypothetical protein
MSVTRVLPIFSAAFALVYVLSVEANWALVTYHPRINEWEWLTKPAKLGPPMYWYGWLATSFLAACAISVLALPLTRRWSPPVWIGWAGPLAVMLVFVYLLRSFFLR